MGTLVVYYTRTGNAKRIAVELAGALGADIEEIFEVKSHKGLIGYMKAGRESMKKQLDPIKPTQQDPSKYALVIIGTPIWAWTMCGPIRTYISENAGKFKRVAFFCTCQGNREKTFEEMAELCKLQPVATMEFLDREIKAGTHAEKLKSFTESLKA